MRRLRLEERVTIRDLRPASGLLDIWYPVIPDGPFQRVLDLHVDTDAPFHPGHDPNYGNPMRHLALHGDLPPSFTFGVSYLVYRIGDGPIADAGSSDPSGHQLSQYLEVGVDGADPAELNELGRRLAGDERDPLRRAVLLVDGMRRRTGSELERTQLLINLFRYSNTPARLVCGHHLDDSEHGSTPLSCPHYWVEFFVSRSGWLSADPCCPPSPGGPFAIGQEHVVRSRGQDLLLHPVQRGRRLPTFWQTYVELNGRPHPVSTTIRLEPQHAQQFRPPESDAVQPGLAELFRTELHHLESARRPIRLPRGATLTLASSREQWLFLLLEGRLRISRLTPAGRKLELSVLQSPAMFLGGRLLRGFGEAIEDSALIALSHDDVADIGGRRPDFASLLLDTLSERLLESDERMEYLAYHGLPARIAMALLKLADYGGVVSGVTHQEIADMVGAYRETVTKVLHDFKRAGYVALANRRIELKDGLALTRMLDD